MEAALGALIYLVYCLTCWYAIRGLWQITQWMLDPAQWAEES
jgi:hypothetical protein